MRSIRIRSLNIQCTNCVQKLNQTVHISLHVILEGGGVCFRFLSYATVSPNDGSMFFFKKTSPGICGAFSIYAFAFAFAIMADILCLHVGIECAPNRAHMCLFVSTSR